MYGATPEVSTPQEVVSRQEGWAFFDARGALRLRVGHREGQWTLVDAMSGEVRWSGVVWDATQGRALYVVEAHGDPANGKQLEPVSAQASARAVTFNPAVTFEVRLRRRGEEGRRVTVAGLALLRAAKRGEERVDV